MLSQKDYEALLTERGDTNGEFETCRNCGLRFRDGDGIAGMSANGHFEAYDFDCAIKLGIEGDEHECLVSVADKTEQQPSV